MDGYSFISTAFPLLFAGLLILYHLLPGRLRPVLLLVFSFLLYAQEGGYALLFLFGVILLCYLGGLWLSYLKQKEKAALAKGELSREEKQQLRKLAKRQQRLALWTILLSAFGVLALTKFPLLPDGGSLVMPLGLSFFLFQALGYVIDVKMGKIAAERNLLSFALFVSFFPQLIQGPIGRYKDLTPTLLSGNRPTTEDTKTGLIRMVTGYIKKLVLADRLTAAVALLWADRSSGAAVALGAVLYAFRLLWDFSGGIDIALGAARMLGIRMAENFRAPYLSRNLEEYWTRWHISMGSWFRDYIFYPVNMSPRILHLGRLSKGKRNILSRISLYISLLLTWLATGLWHGNSWNYVLWGLTNGIILILREELRPLRERAVAHPGGQGREKLRNALSVLCTFILLCLIRLWDCYPAPAETVAAFWRLFTAFFAAPLPVLSFSITDIVLLSAGFAATLFGDIRIYRNKELQPAKWPEALFALAVIAGILLILVFGKYGIGYTATDFIYGQF